MIQFLVPCCLIQSAERCYTIEKIKKGGGREVRGVKGFLIFLFDDFSFFFLRFFFIPPCLRVVQPKTLYLQLASEIRLAIGHTRLDVCVAIFIPEKYPVLVAILMRLLCNSTLNAPPHPSTGLPYKSHRGWRLSKTLQNVSKHFFFNVNKYTCSPFTKYVFFKNEIFIKRIIFSLLIWR